MELLQQLLSQYVEKQENAQRHFANKGYGNEFKPVRSGENHQNYQNFNHLSDQNRDTNSSSASVETFSTNVQGKGRFVPNCLNPCVFCQGSHLMMNAINIKNWLIISNTSLVKDVVFFV